MSTSKEEKNLFEEFSPISTEQWEEAIQKSLKGSDFRQKLLWRTGEGIEMLPFYRRDDLEALDLPKRMPSTPEGDKTNNWEIRQPIFDQDVKTGNAAALRALECGADALQFRLRLLATTGTLGGDLEGTSIQSQVDFDKLFENIDLTQTPLHFDWEMASPVLLAMLHNALSARGLDASAASGTLLYDPYAYIVTNGQLPKPQEAFLSEAAQMVSYCDTYLSGMRCLGVDARIYHDAGATIVQEVGYALAVGNEILARLNEHNLSVDEIAPQIHFNFAIGSSYFLEIAKFRAMRILWQMIIENYGLDDPDTYTAYIHAESSEWNKTVFDPYSNMLRTTTEGMSAAVAGCDSVTLEPFDKTYRQPDELSQRIARNTQIILKEEAYFNKVADPAAGSYYIEILTDKIAKAAWECFREIEQQGGMFRAVCNGYVQSAIEAARRDRDRAIAKSRRVFVGTNKYANPDEYAESKLDSNFSAISLKTSNATVTLNKESLVESIAEALRGGAMLGDLIPALLEEGKLDIPVIRPYRGPEVFEQLRLATKRHQTTPKVLTLPLGNKRLRKARSSFAANFFSSAGYNIEDPIGFESVEEAVESVASLQPEVVVLCSSDEEYKQWVPQLCEKLKLLEKQPLIVVAGYPEAEAEQYKAAGVDAFIHHGSNILETLTWFQQQLGVIKNTLSP